MKQTFLTVIFLLATITGWSQKVFVLELKDEIHAPTARYIQHGIATAEAEQVDLILLHLDTYGGRVDHADSIRNALLDTKIPTAVFIDRNAASAGALIALACDSIYMAPGSSIGAATVVDGGTGDASPDKYQSYWRGIMRSTAELQGRDPLIAEKMVDQKLDLPGISPVGQVITFSTQEALRYDYCDGVASNFKEVAAAMGIANPTLLTYEPTGVDSAINFLINPMVTSLLVLIIFAGFFMEFKTPGMGIAGLLGLAATALFFAPHYIEGLVEYWEVAVFGAGILLIAVEIFVIPGFGLAGILGILFSVAGLVTGMLDNEGIGMNGVGVGEIIQKTAWVLVLLISAILLVVVLAKYLLTSSRIHPLVDLNTQDKEKGYTTASPELLAYKGKVGTAVTDLRPGGFIEVAGKKMDAEAPIGFVGKGKQVKVLRVTGFTLIVEEV